MTRDVRLRAVVLALITVVAIVAAPVGMAGADTDLGTDDALASMNGKTTPFTARHFDRTLDFETTDDVVTHGEGLPGWYIGYSDGSFGDLETWVDASDDRTLLDHDNGSNRALVIAPARDIRRGSIAGIMVDGLSTRSWVEWFEIEQKARIVEPVDLKSDDVFETEQKPRRLTRALARINGGEFTAKGLAYSGDVNETDLSDVHTAIGADSIDSNLNGSGIRLAVLDTGANVADGGREGAVFGNGSDNSSLRIVAGKNLITNATIDTTSGNYSAIEDGDGHGTYVLARAAGAGEGNASHKGLAHDSDLIVGKVLGDDGTGSIEEVISGLEWACGTENADVVSLSLGSAAYSKAVEDEIHECLEDDGASAVTVAVGNSRWSTRWVGSPADADGVIGVTSTTTDGPKQTMIAYFANVGRDDGFSDGSGGHTRGEIPDVGAPGMKNTVKVVDERGNVVESTLSGTSMSTPEVAAAIAVLLEDEPSLKGDHEAIRERVIDTAVGAPKIAETEIGPGGQLNVSRLVDDDRSGRDQANVMNEDAEQRDRANLALTGRAADLLRSRGVDL